MAKIIRMPEVLAGADEAVISQWLMAEGADVAVGDTLAEIETEKATVEYQAEDAGTLGRVLLAPGLAAAVGDPIAVFLEPGDDEGAIDKALADAGIGPSASPPNPSPAEPTPGAAASEPASPAPAEMPASPVKATSAPAEEAAYASAHLVGARQPGERIFMSPIARKLAKERGIAPEFLTGSGPNGRIVRRDVDNYVPSGPGQAESTGGGSAEESVSSPLTSPPTSPPTSPAAQTLTSAVSDSRGAPSAHTDTPHTPMRKAIARRLTESKSTVPHFYLVADVRVDKLLDLRQEVNEGLGVKISVNDWVIKAVATALVQVPDANVIWTDSALRRFDDADISVAVATDGGLYTPVVRGANRLTLAQISHTVKDLAERARSGTIRQEDIEGGSFAVTNLGMFGTQEFSAILNPPQSGILALGAAGDRPVADNGEVVVRKVMTITLSCDHRAIDGALAAVFLGRLQALLEHPASILAT